jgi:hypothetical protein
MDTNPTPEAIIEQLRAVRDEIVSVKQLSPKERKALRGRSEITLPVLQASINVIGTHDLISQAIDRPVDDVRRLQDEWGRWTAVEEELRALLNGVSGANLVRWQELVFIASQACAVAAQLARSPANSHLVPHIEEIRRLRKLARARRKGDSVEDPKTDG